MSEREDVTQSDTCRWCTNLWAIAVNDQAGDIWGACPDHTHLLPPWIDR